LSSNDNEAHDVASNNFLNAEIVCSVDKYCRLLCNTYKNGLKVIRNLCCCK